MWDKIFWPLWTNVKVRSEHILKTGNIVISQTLKSKGYKVVKVYVIDFNCFKESNMIIVQSSIPHR